MVYLRYVLRIGLAVLEIARERRSGGEQGGRRTDFRRFVGAPTQRPRQPSGYRGLIYREILAISSEPKTRKPPSICRGFLEFLRNIGPILANFGPTVLICQALFLVQDNDFMMCRNVCFSGLGASIISGARSGASCHRWTSRSRTIPSSIDRPYVWVMLPPPLYADTNRSWSPGRKLSPNVVVMPV